MSNYYAPNGNYMGFNPNIQYPFQAQPQGNTGRYSNKYYVSGIEGARSYPVPPNTEMILCDDTSDVIYDVVVDNAGKRTITALDVKVHEEAPPVDMSKFATKEDIIKLREELLKNTQHTNVAPTRTL